MGFKDEIGRLDSARDEALRRTAETLEENRRRNADAVVAEIQQTLADAAEYLSRNSRHSPASIVTHRGPRAPQRRLFGRTDAPEKYSNPSVAGHCWPADSGWVITDTAQLLRQWVTYWPTGGRYGNTDEDRAAAAAGLADGKPYVLVEEGLQRHVLDPKLLIVVTEDEWRHGGPKAGGWWTTGVRGRYAAILDGPHGRRACFGITPSGKAAAVSVQEADHYADGTPFSMTAFQLDTWLAGTIHERSARGL